MKTKLQYSLYPSTIMKIKTSVSLEERDLEKIKAIARKEDRPYSWVLQKLVRIAIDACGEDTEAFCKRIKELAREAEEQQSKANSRSANRIRNGLGIS